MCLFLLLMGAVSAQADEPSLDVMAGQMIMAGFRGDRVSADSRIIQDITERHLGGVVLFDYDVALGKADRNIKSPQQLETLIDQLQAAAPMGMPLLVGIDQEGGKVQRLRRKWGFTETPSAQQLGSEGPQACRTAGGIVGKTLASVGINMDFAPVADVNVNPKSPVIGALGRSFSADPQTVAEDALAFVQGLADHGVIACLKHFPGHGSATADSHLGVTDVTETWTDRELEPYQWLFAQGYEGMVMTAHVFNARLDPDRPATLSKIVIDGVLRRQLGWDGVVITDDMEMKAVSKAYGLRERIRLSILAGADILLFGNNLSYDPAIVEKVHSIIIELVNSGEIESSRIRQSYDRIMNLKQRLIPGTENQ